MVNYNTGYFEMKEIKSGEIVRVYSINPTNNMATVWSDNSYYNQNGAGWKTVKITKLMPTDYKTKSEGLQPSKTLRNKAKSRLCLSYAEWETSDGEMYTHNNLEDAIEHEIEIMKKSENEQ